MSCESNNATPPSPAIAPGAELIDPAAAARTTVIDPRLPALVPGFDAPFFQAGLAGYSDAAMRIIARRHGCPYCVTEALLDRTLLAGGRGFAKADLGELEDNIPGGVEDQPLAGQIMGCDPQEMADAAVKMIEQPRRALLRARANEEVAPPDDLRFASIDVNLACPVKKIKAKARGGHWLREPEGAIEILGAVRRALPDHVLATVKLRRGSDDSPEAERNFFRIFDAAYDLGYSWATVHGRTVEQKYIGPSRWTFLRDLVRRNPDRVVFGSGDIWDVHDIFRMLAYTGVRAAAVARGCIGNPWIFRQARDMMAGRPPLPPTLDEQRAVLLAHFDLSSAVNGERRAGMLMRKFAVRFAAHHPRAEEARVAFIRAETCEDWRAIVDQFYPHAISSRGSASAAEAVAAPH
ncbi:MAG TPA: tRNA-dihydrouridine synthase family protein [Phycisphaerales bacterium]|nr:tRNA-dihydrouridine synthase family protein [Phycisphaerales bacterium]